MSPPPAQIVAVLDACVLIPRGLRDLLLSCDDSGLFRPVWQERIENELVQAGSRLLVTRGWTKGEALGEMRRTVERMNSAFEDARLPGRRWQVCEASMTNHSKDRHVLAAAVGSRATHLVTQNLRDFPVDSRPSGVEVVRADTFLLMLLAHDDERVLAALGAMSARHSKPAHTSLDLARQFAAGDLAPRFGMAVELRLRGPAQ